MDTPEIPIRSVAMGLVEIHGKATGTPPIPSPVTQTPCYFYTVDVEHWVTIRTAASWSHLVTDADGPRFYVADATGKVLVDAHKAEYDLIQTARVETRGSFGLGLGRLLSGIGNSTGTPRELRPDLGAYASSAVARRKGRLFGSGTGRVSATG
jgi:hypothetical protein